MFVQLICQRCRCIEETVVPKANIWNMNYNDLENDIKYLNATKTDMHFGVYVNTVGIQIIKAGEHYPLKDHPSGYFFNGFCKSSSCCISQKGQGRLHPTVHRSSLLPKELCCVFFPDSGIPIPLRRKSGGTNITSASTGLWQSCGFVRPALRPIIPCSKSVSMPSW